jgi:hypothetical protein
MHRFPRYGLLPTALLAMTMLAALLSQRFSNPAPSWRSLDHWDIPELADHLNRAGLEVQLRSTRIDGSFGHNAFLTSTDKEWSDLNRLGMGPGRRQIQAWHGTVYCERVRGQDPADLIRQWGDRCLVAGPFIFYGDAKLSERIHTALAPFAPSTVP